MALQSDASRSFTNPLSNIVVLSSLDVRRYIAEINSKDIPLSFLPAFLHEATHHWCFDSPVGLAQFFLFCRARRAALNYMSKKGTTYTSGHWDVYDSVQRYEFIQGLMRPLAEGIALFAEHDAATTNALTISLPLALAGTLFARGLAVRQGTKWEKLPLVLAGGRLTPQHIRNKTNLLVQSLDFQDGGYLAGYLCVKNLWMANLIHLASPAFMDTDLYLQFIRSYFYEDWGLVARLLDDTRGDVGALAPISDHLQHRLIAFATEDGREKKAKDFERRSNEKDWKTLSLRAGLATAEVNYDPSDTNPETELGRQRFQAAFEELFDKWPEDEQDAAVVQMDIATLQLRGTIALGHAQLDAHVIDSQLRFLDEGRPVFGVLRPNALPLGWSGKLEIDVIVNAIPPGLYLFVTHEGKIVEALSLGQSVVPEELKAHFTTRQFRAEAERLTNELFQDVLRNDAIEVARNHARKQLARIIEGVYLPRALVGPLDENFTRVREAARENGLLGLLVGDIRGLADVAAASLCTPLSHRLDSLTSFHDWSQKDPLDSVSHLNSILAEQLGFEPFFIVQGEILASFV